MASPLDGGCEIRRIPPTDHWPCQVARFNYGIMSAADWNVLLALVPMALIEVKQTMTIKASMTAYSTAVGPSSETTNFLTLVANDFNMTILSF